MKQAVIFLFCALTLSSCFFTQSKNLDFCDTLTSLKVRSSGPSPDESVVVKRVYKLKNGLVVDQYNGHYGYWYMVRQGDSLYRIARANSITVPLLASVNRMAPSARLQYKAFLFIPITESYLNRYGEVLEVRLRKGEFIWPVLNSYVRSGFGLRQWGWRKKFHKGIDLPAPLGTKVYAAGEGEVVEAGWWSDYGYMVRISHNGHFHTVYAHMAKLLVSRGETVEQGQVIGLVGQTGHATGTHLHFEVRINNTPVNPVDYLPENQGEELFSVKDGKEENSIP